MYLQPPSLFSFHQSRTVALKMRKECTSQGMHVALAYSEEGNEELSPTPTKNQTAPTICMIQKAESMQSPLKGTRSLN